MQPELDAQRVIAPQPGPQTEFLNTDADIAIYGGAAGGGKTFGAVLHLAGFYDVPGFGGIVFRRTNPELTGSGSVWEATRDVFPLLGGKARESPYLQWSFPSGATVELRHLQHESDVLAHQSKQYACVLFEELTGFEESQFWYLLSRLRSTSGVRPHVRATCNPDPESFVRKLVDWWIDPSGTADPSKSGVLRWFARQDDVLVWGDTRDEVIAKAPRSRPLSLTFIPARLDDNPALTRKDPEYSSKLEALPQYLRDRLLGGNWNSRAAAGTLFKRHWFKVFDEPPSPRVYTIRFWDKAASEPSPEYPDPDWTVGVKQSLLADGSVLIEDLVALRGTPGAVDDAMFATATQDGRGVRVGVFQDPGQAGISDVDKTKAILRKWSVVVIKATKNKVTYAEAWSAQAEKGRVHLLRGAWNDRFFNVTTAFPDGKHDDDVDAVSGGFQALPIGGADFIEAMKNAQREMAA